MKKLAITACLMLAAVATFGQGQVIFANASTSPVTNTVTGVSAPGGAAQDDTQVALYIGLVGDAVGSLTMSGNATNFFSAGRFSGGTRTTAFPAGPVQLQVRAWLATTVYPSYEAAYAAGFGGDASVYLGVSAPFTFNLTVPPTTPSSINGNGFNSFGISPVPEPSSIALGLLGLGAIALFRRRK